MIKDYITPYAARNLMGIQVEVKKCQMHWLNRIGYQVMELNLRKHFIQVNSLGSISRT